MIVAPFGAPFAAVRGRRVEIPVRIIALDIGEVEELQGQGGRRDRQSERRYRPDRRLQRADRAEAARAFSGSGRHPAQATEEIHAVRNGRDARTAGRAGGIPEV